APSSRVAISFALRPRISSGSSGHWPRISSISIETGAPPPAGRSSIERPATARRPATPTAPSSFRTASSISTWSASDTAGEDSLLRRVGAEFVQVTLGSLLKTGRVGGSLLRVKTLANAVVPVGETTASLLAWRYRGALRVTVVAKASFDFAVDAVV